MVMPAGEPERFDPAMLERRFWPVAVVTVSLVLPSSRRSGPVGARLPARIELSRLRWATPNCPKLLLPPPEKAELPETVEAMRLSVALPPEKTKL